MLKRLRLPSPAMVVAMIALFAALGGGYAMAFSGSGTLQKSALDGLSTYPTFQNARTLVGFGTLQASCKDNGSDITYRLDNTTSSVIEFRAVNELTDNSTADVVGVGEKSTEFDTDHPLGEVEFHLSKLADGHKAQVVAWAQNTRTNNCFDENVRVLALNTQQ